MSSPEIVIEPRAAELAADVAERTQRVLAAAQREHPLAHLVVTGGSILESVLAAIREAPLHGLDWTRVAIWWGDERFVAADSAERNDLVACELLFDHVSIAPHHLHRMPALTKDAGAGELDEAALAYAGALAAAAEPGVSPAVPAFDVVLLGMGPDGHCASLFPGQPAVHESGATVVGVADSPKPPPLRISLTFAALYAARQIWVIASGEAKAVAVAKALAGGDPMEVPVAAARGRERTIWFLDNDAASLLP